MSRSTTESGAGELSAAFLWLIDAGCDQFEHAWRIGERPDIADYLGKAIPPIRARLFHDLLTLEMEFRISQGEIPDPASYSEAFPQYPAVIAGVFENFARLPGSRVRPNDHAEMVDSLVRASRNDRAERFGTALPRADLDPTVLESLRSAGYEIQGELGRGGMGVVYLARKMALNRPCAVKMILAGMHAGATAIARFRAEAEAVARLRHPAIVQIYHVGEAAGLPFLELEYLPGGNLDQTLNGMPWPAGDAARLVETLTHAIAEAHGKGIVHRDLKPANVLLDGDGSPKLADFGLAKFLDSDSNLTRTQTILGSPSYMAPEQAEGRSNVVGATSDIYALGAILYTLVVGAPPFRAATALETLAQVKSADPVPPSRLQPGLPRDIETICLKCLEKVPARRYGTAQSLADDLGRFRAGRSILARPASHLERAWKWARHRPTMAAALAVGLVASCILLAGIIYYNAQLKGSLERTRRAEQAAIDRGEQAIAAYSRLVSDVQEKLGDTAATRSIRQGLLTTAIDGLDETARTPGGAASDLYLAVARQKLGEILRQVGRVDEARIQLGNARRLAEQLAAADPENLAVAECLRDVCLGQGELLLRDEQAREATGYFRRALTEAKTIATADLHRPGSRFGLAESYQRLGRALDAAGEMPEARDCFRTMQELAAQWVHDEPKSAAARDMLASSYLRLARVRRYDNDLEGANRALQQSISIARELWIADPKNLTLKTHLALSLLDSAMLARQRRQFVGARVLFAEAMRLHSELAESDPEDREAQVWLVHTQLHFGRLERDEEHYAAALELFRPALERLRQLDREKKLEGRPSFKYRHMTVLDQEIVVCEAAPRVADQPALIQSQSPAVTVSLLRIRARRLAEQGRDAELVATVEQLCAFDEGDWEHQYALSGALASCMAYFGNQPPGTPHVNSHPELKERCAQRAIAALARAIDRGLQETYIHFLEDEFDLVPIRDYPAFHALIEKAKLRNTHDQVRYPVR